MSRCAVCGCQYYVPPSHRATRISCSHACRAKLQSEWQRRDLATRFWEKVDKRGNCWIWTASTLKTGYGCIRIDQKTIRAHRVAYELCVGPVPQGRLLRHSCDNKRCVNPSHLIPGTKCDNAVDAVLRGQHRVGERDTKARLSNADVAVIRIALADGVTGRALAQRFNVDESHISHIKHGKSRKHG